MERVVMAANATEKDKTRTETTAMPSKPVEKRLRNQVPGKRNPLGKGQNERPDKTRDPLENTWKAVNE